jgi:hypothetical protein
MNDDRTIRTNTGRFAEGNRGKPPGTRNRLTMAARQAFQAAFDNVGGVHRLTLWASENPGEFYKLYARLIPQDNINAVKVYDSRPDAERVRRKLLDAINAAQIGSSM